MGWLISCHYFLGKGYLKEKMLSRSILKLAAMLMQMQMKHKGWRSYLVWWDGGGKHFYMITMRKTLNMNIFYYWYLGFSFKMIMFEIENILLFEEKNL